jgi:hypothetical protein
VIRVTFEVVATSFRMYLSLFSLPKSIGRWGGTEQEGQSQAIFSIHLWKKFKIYWVVFVYPQSMCSYFSWTNGPQTKRSGLHQGHVLIEKIPGPFGLRWNSEGVGMYFARHQFYQIVIKCKNGVILDRQSAYFASETRK